MVQSQRRIYRTIYRLAYMENSLQANWTKPSRHSFIERCIKLFSRDTAIVLALNAVICSVVAVFIWFSSPDIEQFSLWSSWVYAQCIGQLICIGTIILSSFKSTWPQQYKFAYYLSFPLIVAFGFFAGQQLAGFFLGQTTNTYFGEPVYWFILLVTICVSVFSIWFFSSRNRMARLKIQAAEESALASQAKLSMLQAQIEPHMLFNTLSNLRILIDTDPVRAQDMLDHLVDYLRATLASSQQEETTLKDEFDLLDNYLCLMQIRMGERLSFTLNLPTELETLQIPILILQPLVENAIKHGIEPKLNGGHISVTVQSEETCISIEVLDTGVGYSSFQPSSNNGFGLKNVRERLSIPGSTYETLTVNSPTDTSNTGTSIIVRVPKPDSLVTAETLS